MPLYEHVFIARHDISAQQMEALDREILRCFERKWRQSSKLANIGDLKTSSYRIKKESQSPLWLFAA